MLVLLDHATPRALRRYLPRHTVHVAALLAWERLPDGQMLTRAEEAGYELLITLTRASSISKIWLAGKLP